MAHEDQRISRQHQMLHELYANAKQALESGQSVYARDELKRFIHTLRTHMQLEEEATFPQLCALEPSVRPEIESLIEDHGNLRIQIDTIERWIEKDDLGQAGRALSEIGVKVAHHEFREEKLIEALQQASQTTEG